MPGTHPAVPLALDAAHKACLLLVIMSVCRLKRANRLHKGRVVRVLHAVAVVAGQLCCCG